MICSSNEATVPLSLKTWYLDTEGRKMQKEQGQVCTQSCILTNEVTACISIRDCSLTWQHGAAYLA